jgi:heterotetrameric sarcosine oxidase gamma subunit
MVNNQPVFQSPVQTQVTKPGHGDPLVVVEDIAGAAALVIQGSSIEHALTAAFGLACPVAPGQVVDSGNTLIICSTPSEFYTLGITSQAELPQATALDERFKVADNFAYATDITHGKAVVKLSGVAAAGTLRKICGLDFDDASFSNLQAKHTSAAKIRTLIVRRDEAESTTYYLVVDRPMGQYFWDTLLDAGHEFGIVVKNL